MDEVDDFLAHFGVKGMRWGVRKSDVSVSIQSKGVTVRSDGSMSLEQGASLQRLVRSNGKSLPLKDITYASINEYDNARYIKVIGGKSIFGTGRDQIMAITATQKIEAPSFDKAVRMNSEMMINDPKFRQKNTHMFGEPINKKDMQRIVDDPGGKTAQDWYTMTNTKLTFDASFDPDAPYVQKAFREKMLSNGFNAVRDENDFQSKISKAPIIIFEPEKSLKVTNITQITDVVRKANKETLQAYNRLGKGWVERELYND